MKRSNQTIPINIEITPELLKQLNTSKWEAVPALFFIGFFLGGFKGFLIIIAVLYIFFSYF